MNEGSKGTKKQYKAGYEYLLAYKITIPIYDYTVIFCKRAQSPHFPNFPQLSSSRTFDQMVQAARSGSQNIAEGNQQSSLEGYIKLTAVNLMITLVNQAIFLQKRLAQSLTEKFIKEGGFRENLFKKRSEFKKR